jgi:hypothetical protein
MRPDNPLPVFLDECDEVPFLIGGPVPFAGDEEEHGVKIIQVLRISGRQRNRLLGDPLRVGPDVRVIQPGLAAQVIDDR